MAENKNGRKRLKRFRKVYEEIHPTDLDIFKTVLGTAFIVWILFMIFSTFIPDSGFPKGRLVALYSVTVACVFFPGIMSLFHFLTREVYWEEVK